MQNQSDPNSNSDSETDLNSVDNMDSVENPEFQNAIAWYPIIDDVMALGRVLLKHKEYIYTGRMAYKISDRYYFHVDGNAQTRRATHYYPIPAQLLQGVIGKGQLNLNVDPLYPKVPIKASLSQAYQENRSSLQRFSDVAVSDDGEESSFTLPEEIELEEDSSPDDANRYFKPREAEDNVLDEIFQIYQHKDD